VQQDPKLQILRPEDLALAVQYLIETPQHFSIWNMDLMALEQVFNPL
jgi:NADP-dependent 3-hydroxy acid dehydrogenase YdfG